MESPRRSLHRAASAGERGASSAALGAGDISGVLRTVAEGKLGARMRADRRDGFRRCALTVVLFSSWICLGFYGSCLGPSLPALRASINGTTEQVSRALSTGSAGLLLGSVLGGLAHDRFQALRGCFVAGALLAVSVVLCLVPLCASVLALALNLFALGVCRGVHTTGGNSMMVELWASRTPGPLSFMHAGFGIGSAVVPPLLRAFAEPRDANSSAPLRMRLQRSYVALAAPCLLTGLLLLLLTRMTARPRNAQGTKEESRLCAFWAELTSSRRNLRITALLLTAMFFFYFLVNGGERVYERFLFSYASEGPLAFSAAEALWLNSAIWIAFTVARFVAAAALLKVPVDAALCVQMVGELLTACLMLALPPSRLAFWTGVIALAFFKSPAFVTGLSCVNLRVEICGTVSLIANIGSALGALAMQWPVSFFFDKLGPDVFLRANAALAAAATVVSVLMIGVGRWKGSRFKPREEEVAEEGLRMVPGEAGLKD